MNILSFIQTQLSPQVVGDISNAIGENSEGTKSALDTAFPALLGSVVGKATSSPDGANDVFNLATTSAAQGGSWMDSLRSALGGGTAAPASGNSLLNSLLGSRLGPVADFIGGHSGIKSSSATSILGMAAPLLMGLLGKHAASQGMGASGLAQLLGSQTRYLKDALPSGLANTLGIGNLLAKGTDTAKLDTSGVRRAESERRYEGQPYTPQQREATSMPRAQSGSVFKWLWLPIIVALGAWYFISKSNREQMGGTSDQGQVQVGREISPGPLTRPTPGSTADKLNRAVASGNLTESIALQDVTFDSSGNVAAASLNKLQELASVLKSSPNLNIVIIGYGATEDAGMNQAAAIQSALISSGVSRDRVAARGEAGSSAPTLTVRQ